MTAARPRVWITRTQPDAARTAGAVEAMGHEAVVAPLLAIRPLPVDLDLTGVAALAFTSRNGVAAFAALTSRRDWPVFTVGDATAEAARAAGFAQVRSAGGAIDDLAALIGATWPDGGGPILASGAREPAGDLAGALAGRAEVRRLPVYEAVETDVAVPERFDAVLVHSPRAARALAGRAGPRTGAGRIAVAISAAAAAPLEGLGFDAVRIAAAPTEAAVLAALGKPPGRV